MHLSEAIKYRLLVGHPAINWLNRVLRPSNWLARLRRRKVIAAALASGRPVKLFIGCGRSRRDDTWLHADIHRGDIYINATRRLPFEDNKVDFVFSEHFIEHLPEVKIRKFWKECFRILKPGGRMRHSTPDLDFYVRLFRGETENATLDKFYNRIRHIRKETPHASVFMNEVLTLWGHVFNYNENYLRTVWEEAGFINVTRSVFGKSSVPELSNLEQHGDEEWYRYQATLVMEAQKPFLP